MKQLIDSIINWSEVWALLIPLTIILVFRPKGPGVKPLIIYLVVAILLNTIATVIVEFYFSLPTWIRNNNILYNLHSLSRVLFFSWYIISIRDYRFPQVLKLLLGAYLVFIGLDFIFWEPPLLIATNIFTAESIVLLLFCFSFFFRSMQDESQVNWLKHPAFLVCTGVCFYETVSFFIFLFFYPLYEKNPEFGDLTMSIHNIIYLVLCITLAMALYKSRQRIVYESPQ